MPCYGDIWFLRTRPSDTESEEGVGSNAETPTMPTHLRPPESTRQRYFREVREACEYLSPDGPYLRGDLARALRAVQRWAWSNDPSAPPEPEATRIKSAAAMLRAGTLRVR